MLLPPKERTEVDDIELVKQFKKDYNGYYLAVDQVFVLSYTKTPFILTIDRIFGNNEGASYLSQ
jgi:hypothetical protein